MAKHKEYWLGKLAEQKAELIQLEAKFSAANQTVELDQQRIGRLSRMDALQSQEMDNAISARRKQALLRNESARERLEDGEFGYCLKCGDEIVEKRLELDATALYCTSCNLGS